MRIQSLYSYNAAEEDHSLISISLQLRHNEHVGVSSHQPHDCLLNRLFKAQIKENIIGEFPAQRSSDKFWGFMFLVDGKVRNSRRSTFDVPVKSLYTLTIPLIY